LLYAGAEHIAWVSAVEAFLHGKRRVPPSIDPTQCRLGAWMASESLESRPPIYRQVARLHLELHSCGVDILTLNAENRAAEAADAVARLHSIRESLLAALGTLFAHK
jgi:hypothetical protein